MYLYIFQYIFFIFEGIHLINSKNQILPKAGLVYSEKGNLSEVLCKPKIMPIKSSTLEQIEQMEKIILIKIMPLTLKVMPFLRVS